MPSRPRTPAYTPAVGEIVRDLGHRDTSGQPLEAVDMDTLGGLVYLRHAAGGCEWTTKPQHVQPLPAPRFITVQTPSRPRSAGAA